ncbi:MAG: hypothetical protein ROW48_08280 [Bellilinea sp.]|jgi:16S rRNA (guanine(1405)-N(7))-methyltransferase
MADPLDLQSLLDAVRANPRYAAIAPDLICALIEKQRAVSLNPREIVKAVRNKLHQAGGAYLDKPINYPQWTARLAALPNDLKHPAVLDFCRAMMALHASTRERLPYFEYFYTEILAVLPPINSMLDLACGLNPLALPWMNLPANTRLDVCDIYTDQIAFLQAFFDHFGCNAHAELCDLTTRLPDQPAQLALLLKTIPCLEQLDKSAGQRLLAELPAEHLLVTFPARSLGGRDKGMRRNYENRFHELIRDLPWQVRRFDFPGELVFLLSRAGFHLQTEP